uniref:MD-2-related lipid-recognition domain-containing protein n=1 Tax=Anopheles christyi TaxID=43041 RepID=A0A182K8P3_9DIPT
MLPCWNVLFFLGVLPWIWPCSYAQFGFNYSEEKNLTRPFKIKVHRVVCIDTPYEETILHECRTIFRRNQRPLLSVSLEVPKMYDYLMIHFQLYYKFTTYQTFLIDTKAEGCNLMRDHKSDPKLNYMYGVLNDMMSPIVHPCPFGNRTYIQQAMLKEENAPRSVPAGDYRMDVRLSSKTNVTVIWMQLYFEVRRKGILNSMLEW